jgi:hypothetical protein
LAEIGVYNVQLLISLENYKSPEGPTPAEYNITVNVNPCQIENLEPSVQARSINYYIGSSEVIKLETPEFK